MEENKPIRKNQAPVSVTNRVIEPATSNDQIRPKHWWLNMAIAFGGIIGFILPWISIRIFGITIASINGFQLPNFVSEMDNPRFPGVNGGMSDVDMRILYCLYLVPICFAAIIVLEYLRKRQAVKVLSSIVIACIAVFLVMLLITMGMQGIQFLSFGPILTMAASIVILANRK